MSGVAKTLPETNVAQDIDATRRDRAGDDGNPELEVREDNSLAIGPYLVIDKLGEGGFGNVYHARQSEPVRREVAVKVLKLGMDSRQILARFEIERQTLAMMDHAGIAKVFDAGTTAAGQPYFVMELVRGIPITRYCDRKKLGLTERVRLFIDVCHAVQHAHHKGVIHRDLKPSNILVTVGDERPKPVVIDFGVAKTTQGHLGDQSVVTHLHQMIGTPLYMSPEQAEMSSLDIDTRTDVYSLGVVLYELLCGQTPISREEMLKAPALQIVRMLREVEPMRPSQHLGTDSQSAETTAAKFGETTVGLQRQLRSELDWIVMKCLEKQRSNRYATVSGLAQDLQRYLDNEPIQARRPTLAYSLRKFAAKNRLLAISAALILASMVTGTAVSLAMYRQAEKRARDVLRLSDLNELVALEQQLPNLIPTPIDRRRRAMEDWLERAREPASRIEAHRDTLQRLTARGRQEQNKVVFETQEEQWQFDNQLALVQKLEMFSWKSGKIAQVESWIESTPSLETIAQAWKTCLADLRRSHPDWYLISRDGLYPIGKDAVTGLWEFVDLTTGVTPGSTRTKPRVVDGLVYVLVPGGEFQMGSPEDEPGRKETELQHTATVSPFLVSKYEVTQAQWLRIIGYAQKTDHPGELKPTSASWFEAKDYCERLGATLATEAQWEYACRAGTTGAYAGNGQLRDMGWFLSNSDQQLHDIGQKQPNQFNLFDMHGNAIEWVFDGYDPDFYQTAEARLPDPVYPPKHQTHFSWTKTSPGLVTTEQREELEAMLRGGSCLGKASYCRSADRFHEEQVVATSTVTIRPCISDLVKLAE